MCEYCGCQAIPAIDLLTREHDEVVHLISMVRTAHRDKDLTALTDAARHIARVLAPHTRVEEEALFPALAQEFPQQLDVLLEEHRRIEAVLATATDPQSAPAQWPDQVLEVAGLLREHILKEQDGVFPAALIALDPEEWDAIDAVRARVGTALVHEEQPPG